MEGSGVEREREDKLMFELRDQINDLMCSAQLLTPLVREKGDRRDHENLASLNQSLYRLLRTLGHMELCREKQPLFYPAPIDLGGLCRDLGRQVEGVADDLNVSFRWDVDREGLLGMADETLLTQAIFGMVTNAVQAAQAPDREGKVSLRFTSGNGRCRFTVRDNGPGLRERDPDADPLLKSPGGVGMGLEAARRVASLHGGALVLENAEGSGVRAVLSIPVRQLEEGETLRTPVDRTGGFSPLLVELSPVLPFRRYMADDVE